MDLAATTLLGVFAFGAACLTALYAKTALPTPRRRVLGAGGVLAVTLMGVSYLNLWFDDRPLPWLHLHDFYHYFIGAKYYGELGHMRLYACTAAAFDELEADGHDVPAIELIRSLARPSEVERGATLTVAASQCRQAFTPARWYAFKHDLNVLLAYDSSDASWRTYLTDLGNNSPPTWALAAGALANSMPFERSTLAWLPLLDQLLLLVLVPVVVYRTFGGIALLAYLLVYFGNPLAGLGWNGGSYCRADWYVALSCGICALVARRYALAGVLLATAVACRVFPALFALAALLSMLVQRPRNHAAILRFVVAGAATGVVFALASQMIFGTDAWLEFVEVLKVRIDPYGNNSIGLVKVASFWNVLVWPSFNGGGEALHNMQVWLDAVRYDGLSHRPMTALIAVSLLAAALIVCWRQPPATAATILGTVAIYVALAPFTYYYALLALLPLAAWQVEDARRALVLAVVCAGIFALRIASIPFQVETGGALPSLFEVSYQASRVLLPMLALLLAALAVGRIRGAIKPALVLALAVIVTAVAGYRPAPLRLANFHAVDRVGPLRATPGVRFALRNATASWPGSAFLEVKFDGPAQWLRLPLSEVLPGTYRVALYVTVFPRAGQLTLRVGDRSVVIPNSAAPTLAPTLSDFGEVAIGAGSTLEIRPSAVGAVHGPRCIGISGVSLTPVPFKGAESLNPSGPRSGGLPGWTWHTR